MTSISSPPNIPDLTLLLQTSLINPPPAYATIVESTFSFLPGHIAIKLNVKSPNRLECDMPVASRDEICEGVGNNDRRLAVRGSRGGGIGVGENEDTGMTVMFAGESESESKSM
jgi:hypothetical protein